MALANWYYEIWLCKDNKNKRNTESKWWGMFLVPRRIVWQIVCPDANVERHLSTTNTQGMGHENIFSSDICEDRVMYANGFLGSIKYGRCGTPLFKAYKIFALKQRKVNN